MSPSFAPSGLTLISPSAVTLMLETLSNVPEMPSESFDTWNLSMVKMWSDAVNEMPQPLALPMWPDSSIFAFPFAGSVLSVLGAVNFSPGMVRVAFTEETSSVAMSPLRVTTAPSA